jgi:hypothetical protein
MKAHRHRPLSEVERASQPDEVESPCQSRTCVLGDQTDFRMDQGSVSRAREEYSLAPDQLRIGESVCGATAALGRSIEDRGVVQAGQRASLTVAEPSRTGSSDERLPHLSLTVLNHPRNRFLNGTGELIRPSLSMDELTSMQRDFLLFCQDDYTGVDFALSCVEGAYPSIEKQEARALTLKLIRELLDAGYIQAGDLPGGGERWKPLSLSVGETLDRIEKEWDKLGNERDHLGKV